MEGVARVGAIIDRINAELRKIVMSPDVLDRLAKEGSDPVVSSPDGPDTR